MISVLFVCMGNICRSPMAEGAFRCAVESANLQDKYTIDSAGTLGYHAGSAPDSRSIVAASEQNIDITAQQSRKITDEDFEGFDHILVMDRDNLSELQERCPSELQHRITLFLPFIENSPLKEMPDPYYGKPQDFERCMTVAIKAAAGLLSSIEEKKI